MQRVTVGLDLSLSGPLPGPRRGFKMRKFVFTLFALGLSLPAILTAQTAQPTIPVDQIHAGMQGVAYTVFQGVKPEPMDFEVLGVLRNVNGPRGNIIFDPFAWTEGGVHRCGRRHER